MGVNPDQLPLQRRTLDVDGRQIAVLIVGAPGDTPPVVAVHGFASSARYTWQSTGHLLALARAGRYVIAPDLLGHGDSAKPHDPGSYTLDGMVDIVTGVQEAFGDGARHADLLGYSLGSRIGWEVLQRGGPWRRAVLGGYDGRALFDGVDLAGLVAGMTAIANPTVPPATRRIIEIARAVPGNDQQALLALLTGLAGSGRRRPLPELPLLLVVGTDDPLGVRAEELALASPQARFLTVPGRDHISTVPSRIFRSGVVDFLA